MARKLRNIEGFIQNPGKRTRVTLDSGLIEEDIKIDQNQKTDTIIRDISGISQKSRRKKPEKASASISDIGNDDILESLPPEEMDEGSSRAVGGDNNVISRKPKIKRKRNPKKNSKNIGKKSLKKWQKWLIALTAAILLIGGTIALLRHLWPERVLDGSAWDILWQERLAEDLNGRTNILIFGTEPEDYEGTDLTDSIMVASLDQDDGSLYTVSLPRDLYVKHPDCPNYGTSAGKLNEVYACIIDEDTKSNEEEATRALKDKISEILGLDIQYSVHLNWEGFQSIIDSIGGVDVVIESRDPRGIYDYNTGLQLENGPTHLDGLTALKLARARNSEGGYGLENSNFDREIHQQKIVQAVAESVAGGAISGTGQMLNLLNSLGDNLHTNFKASLMNSLLDVSKKIDTKTIIRLPLLDEKNGIKLVTTDNIDGASVVVPTAGTFDYSEIHSYIAKNLINNPVLREAAVIDVYNGTQVAGLAKDEAATLEGKGYKVGEVGNAPDRNYKDTEIYQINPDKTNTAKALMKLYDTEIKTVLPTGLDSEADFIVVVGAPVN